MQARPCPTFGRPVHLRDGSLDYGPVLLLMPFGSHLTVDTLPSGDSEPSPASEAVNPAFGYDAPHPSTRGTSTLLNNALLSAHCDPIRHPDVCACLSHSRLWPTPPRRAFPAGHRGFLQFPRLHSHPVAADTPPMRTAASDSCFSVLAAFAHCRPSRPPEKPCHEATSAFTGCYNRVLCASSFQSMLSEGSTILVSRNGASQATRSESFNLGRTFTDLKTCPCLDTPTCQRFLYSAQTLRAGMPK